MRKTVVIALFVLCASIVVGTEPTANAQTVGDGQRVDIGDGSTLHIDMEGTVPATTGAARDHDTHAPAPPSDPDRHCAEWEAQIVSVTATNGSGTDASGTDDSEPVDPDRHPDQDILDVIIANQSGPIARDSAVLKDPGPDVQQGLGPAKLPKAATNNGSVATYRQGVQQVDADATTQLLLEIQAQEAADAAAAAGVGTAGGNGPVYENVCVLHFVCGGERIDDALAGHLSSESDGDFAEYVNYVGAIVEYVGAIVFGGVDVNNGTLGASIAEGGLGDPTTATSMPVFYFCRRGAGGPIELTNATYAPSFGWDTTVAANYDLPGTRFRLRETLLARLQGELPQTQTIPPIELGYTFVKIPMWLWLIEPFEFASYGSANDLGTVRIANRATLVDVTWEIDGTSYTCTLDELREFVHGVDSITDAAPKCSHRFLQLQDFAITATTRYYIEEQVVYRGSTSSAWPTGGWYAHPTSPEALVPNTINDLSVHNIVSVNVPPGMTADEVRAVANGS